jgi:hypothetical protein
LRLDDTRCGDELHGTRNLLGRFNRAYAATIDAKLSAHGLLLVLRNLLGAVTALSFSRCFINRLGDR